nr:MAG TPA: chromosome partitioning protein [Caudoviricetes sp.]
MAKFDLKGMLSERSAQEIDLPEQKTVYRNPEDLIPSKDNFYSTEDTEKLKQSIRALGILQPLLIEERDGKDYLLAGHRRRKCCLELIKEGLERFKRIPCVYKPKIELSTETETDEIVRKMVIIQSNTYREKTDWEKMTESLQMEELVKELREKTDLEGKTREIVSDLIGVSSTQIGRYHSISSNLSGELMDAFKQNKLNVSTAAELAGLNDKYQNEACKILSEAGQVTLNAAKLLKAQQEQERDIPGQMTIDQALHPHKPEEINTPVPVDVQIDRFYESLRKNIETYVKKSDLNMTTYMLSALYGTVRVRNGQLNYQGTKGGILFNAGTDQEESIGWTEFSKKLIEKYGKKQKAVKMVAVDEPEEKTDGPAKCITGKSQSGICGAAAYCNMTYKCCTQCPDDCNSRCGWLEERCQPAAETPDEKQQEDHSGDLTEMVKHLRNTDKIPDAWPEDLKDIPIPTDVEIIGYLYDEERKLKEFLEIEEKEPGLPYMTILKQQLIVGGLRIIKNLVEDCREEPEESEQSPLPIMRNNDQRKEWLRNYKAWGLWYTDEHIGVRYYKYDFENGARLIAEEYDPEEVKDSWWTHIETSYMHLVGGPEPDRKNGIPKWTYHSKYNRHPNSETELVEFLKEVQK